jgi:hypothetical protein
MASSGRAAISVLVAEVHVEGGGRDPDLVGDLADGGAFVALDDEDALGRFEDLLAAKVAVALGLARGLRGLLLDEGQIRHRC